MNVKRLILWSVVGALLAVWTTSGIIQEVQAAKPVSLSDTYALYVDSTVAVNADTANFYSGTTSHKLLKFDLPTGENWSRIDLSYLVYYDALAAGTATILDTTKDSVRVNVYTGDDDGTPSKLLYTAKVTNMHVLADVVNGDYLLIKGLADSSLLDNLYFQIVFCQAESTYAKARGGAYTRFRVNATWRAR